MIHLASVLIKREEAHSPGRRPRDRGGRDWGGADTSQGKRELPGAGGGEERFSPRASRESVALLIP